MIMDDYGRKSKHNEIPKSYQQHLHQVYSLPEE